MKYIVERIEENIASLENMDTGEIINFNVSNIPFIISEGDVLSFDEKIWNEDVEEKLKREKRISNKMKDLWIP